MFVTAAIRFLLATTLRPVSVEPGEPFALQLADGRVLPADLYTPKGRSRGLILFVHGMGIDGNKDRRQCRACRALTEAGFRVIAPYIEDFAALRVEAGSPQKVAAVIAAVSKHPELGAGGKIGVFSISYAAGVVLRALADPVAQAGVSAALALGTYSEIDSWLAYLLRDPQADAYARMILFRNFLHTALGPSPALEGALDVAIADDYYARAARELPAVLDALNEVDRELFLDIFERPERWRALGDRMLGTLPPQTRDLSVLPVASRIKTPIFLLHGATDNVMPPSQSADLHKALLAEGGRSRLVVTPLLSHGDAALGLRTAPDAIAVLRGFADYFAAVSAG